VFVGCTGDKVISLVRYDQHQNMTPFSGQPHVYKDQACRPKNMFQFNKQTLC